MVRRLTRVGFASAGVVLGFARCSRPAEENAGRLVVDSSIVSTAYPSMPSPMDSSVIASLDSCSALPSSGPREDSAQPSANAQTVSRWSGAVRAFDRFTLFVPDSARVELDTSTHGLVLVWPRCGDRCRF